MTELKKHSENAILRWQVETLDHRVDAELAAMPKEIRADFVRISSLLEEFGPLNVREPYVKNLQGKLWEMRLKGKDGIARAAYVIATERKIIVVHVFPKKTQQTPPRALATATKRGKEAGLL